MFRQKSRQGFDGAISWYHGVQIANVKGDEMSRFRHAATILVLLQLTNNINTTDISCLSRYIQIEARQ